MIGLGASGSGNIASFTAINADSVPAVATITVTPVYTSGTTCTGTPQTFTITVNPTPAVTDPADQTVCNGSLTAAVNFSGTGTGYTWSNDNTSVGLGASGSGNIASFTAINAGSVPAVATITVTPVYTSGTTCTGTPQTFTITVNPTATVTDPSDQIVCNGGTVTAVTFSGTGATGYTWSNDNTSVGLGASGSGNIASFTAINAGIVPAVATITVTPFNGLCAGTPQTFTITVNPTPAVTDPADQTVCNGALTAAINFSGTGTGYTWTNNNTLIGLGASGSGNIASFTAINATSVPAVATITVTPVYTSGTTCTGTPQTFTITVNPTRYGYRSCGSDCMQWRNRYRGYFQWHRGYGLYLEQ